MKKPYSVEEVPSFRVILPGHINFVTLIVLIFLAIIFNLQSVTGSVHQTGPTLFRLAGPFLAAAATAATLWRLFGHEVVLITGPELVLQYEALGIHFSREFDWAAVRNLRPRQEPSPQVGSRDFAIAFDYGARTFAFGDLEPTDAVTLADQLVRRFPQLSPIEPVVINSF